MFLQRALPRGHVGAQLALERLGTVDVLDVASEVAHPRVTFVADFALEGAVGSVGVVVGRRCEVNVVVVITVVVYCAKQLVAESRRCLLDASFHGALS